MRMTRWVDEPSMREEFEQAWQASGVTCSFQNAGEEGNDPLTLIERLARHTYVIDFAPDVMKRAVCPDDIESASSSTSPTRAGRPAWKRQPHPHDRSSSATPVR